jgi:hypothetical protein
MSLYVTILACQIIYIPYIVIVLYTLYWCDQFPYPYGFAILYGSTEINEMICVFNDGKDKGGQVLE